MEPEPKFEVGFSSGRNFFLKSSFPLLQYLTSLKPDFGSVKQIWRIQFFLNINSTVTPGAGDRDGPGNEADRQQTGSATANFEKLFPFLSPHPG